MFLFEFGAFSYGRHRFSTAIGSMVICRSVLHVKSHVHSTNIPTSIELLSNNTTKGPSFGGVRAQFASIDVEIRKGGVTPVDYSNERKRSFLPDAEERGRGLSFR